MSDNISNLIFKVTEKYQDPISGKSFNQDNPNISVVIKDAHVQISININQPQSPKYDELIVKMKEEIQLIEDVLSINIILTSEKKSNESIQTEKRFKIDAKKIIAIASGKGGVGKSTFAVNFAIALKQLNNNVGILDADIYGPSVPRMMGISKKPQANDNGKLIPLENYGIKCMSIGFLIDVDTPAIWRGPMVIKALEQMFNGVEWGQLDYLIIDLPPGTGDAQLTLAQSSKLSGSIIISTPQDIALIDARKGINMFHKVGVPVLGIVENMSYFICETCNTRHEIFSNGGAKKEASKFNTPFLGEIPLDKNLRIHSDEGQPVCITEPDSSISKIYLSIAENININSK